MSHRNTAPASYQDWQETNFGSSTVNMGSPLEFAAVEERILANAEAISKAREEAKLQADAELAESAARVHQIVRQTGNLATEQAQLAA